jgi:hypothetical protein
MADIEKTLKSVDSITGLLSQPEHGEFFVHRNSPLALLKAKEETVFGLLLPWLYDTYRKTQVLPLLGDSAWRLAHQADAEQRDGAVKALKTLPYVCFDIGRLQREDLFPMSGTDPFTSVEGEIDWTAVSQVDLLLAMRLVNEFVTRTRTDQSMGPGSYQGPLSDEVLDRPLPIDWALGEWERKNSALTLHTFALYGLKNPPNTDDAPFYKGPLTLRKLLGMLMDMPYASASADKFFARHIYVADAEHSNYFIVHRSTLGKRHEPLQWQVVVRLQKPIIKYAPRLLLLDVMRDVHKRFEDASLLRQQMGPNGAL